MEDFLLDLEDTQPMRVEHTLYDHTAFVSSIDHMLTLTMEQSGVTDDLEGLLFPLSNKDGMLLTMI